MLSKDDAFPALVMKLELKVRNMTSVEPTMTSVELTATCHTLLVQYSGSGSSS